MICPVCGQDMEPSTVNPTTAECPQCGTYIVLKLPKSARSVPQSAPASNGEYLCHVPGRGEPKVTHPTIQEAITEAKRLVKVQGRAVRIYCTVVYVKPIKEVLVEYV